MMNPDPESRLAKSQPLRGIYFWHHMRLQGLTESGEAVEVLSNEIHALSLEVVGSCLSSETRRQNRRQSRQPQGGKQTKAKAPSQSETVAHSLSLSEVAVRCENQLSSLAARVMAKHRSAREAGDHHAAVLYGVIESSMCMQQAANQAYYAVAVAGRFEFLEVFAEGPGGLELIQGGNRQQGQPAEGLSRWKR